MKVFGVILEANPFHNGHHYFLEQIRQIYHPDVLIAITSTSFSMRGEISLMNKFSKIKRLLKEGIDLVIELPTCYAIQSADYFASQAIHLLGLLNITDIVFGCEVTELEKLEQWHNMIYNEAFQATLSQNLHFRTGYKHTFTQTLRNYHWQADEIEQFHQPNVTLALQYLHAIKKFQLPMAAHVIKRLGNHYHDMIATSAIASATTIRHMWKNHQDVSYYIPNDSIQYLDVMQSEQNLFLLLQYRYLLQDVDGGNIFGYSEGMEHYIRKHLSQATSYTDLLERLKNKRYTTSRFRRLFLYTLLNIDTIPYNQTYLRILGISSIGEDYLHNLPKEIRKQVFCSYKQNNYPCDIQKILDWELQATRLYETITGQTGLTILERQLPIRKETI